MSLAPPQTRSRNQEPRLSSVLLGITCSFCSAQIQLDRLGEHVCPGTGSVPSNEGSYQSRPRPQLRQTSSSNLQHSSHLEQSQFSYYSQPSFRPDASISSSGPTSLTSRVPTSLKIDLGAVSNWPGAKQQGQARGGESGMAGVGRRGFGMDLNGAPSPTSLHPSQVPNPPHAYMSSAPSQLQIESHNQTSPYFTAAQAQSPAAHPTDQYLGTPAPSRAPSPLASRPGAAASVSISISSPGVGPQKAHHRPPGSWNSATGEAMLSPPALPETASSDATIPYTLFSSDASQYAVCAASHHLSTASHLVTGKGHDNQLFRTTSSTKGKGGAYPRPSVSPAVYTQQQQQLCRNTSAATTPASATQPKPLTMKTNREPEKYAQCQADQRGPLKIVNITPRPESVAALQTISDVASGAERVKKVTGFALENESRTVSFAQRRNDAEDETKSARSSQNVPDNSRWNVLRSALRRGMGENDKRTSQDSSFLFEDAKKRRTSSSTGVSEDETSTPIADAPAKLQSFERYKKMAETSASKPVIMARSLSNNSTSPSNGSVNQQKMETRHHRAGSSLDAKARAGMLSALLEEEPFFMESPIDSRLEDAYVTDGDSKSFWNSGHEDTHTPTRCSDAASMGAVKAAHRGSRLLTSELTGGIRLYANGSISSINSSQAEKIRMGETDLLTPSTSLDRLAEIARGTRKDAHVRQADPWDEELDPIEGLDDRPYNGGLIKSRFSQTMSTNLSKATSRQSSHFRRESSVMSSLAPSDSISTPGATDKFHFDLYPASAPVKDKPKPTGSKTCQKCAQSLRGKRFIERDGMLLCEPDWKEMFLPKCRRCEKAIETSAVSSSDGQIKGKWHRACFSCYQCSQPFVGDSFYVHDDKPYCQLHYHEANGSLCASQQCGEPIEGPCLLTADNKRYHPGHLACDYGSGHRPCGDTMIDYFEIGTLKVCETHMNSALTDTIKRSHRPGRANGTTPKAEKRRTVLIDSSKLLHQLC